MKTVIIRKFHEGEEFAVSEVIRTTLDISNRKDYSDEFIEENMRSHSPEIIFSRAKEAHFYVATYDNKIIGCGGITGYWGSTEESYLTSFFVLPDGRRRIWRCKTGKAKGKMKLELFEYLTTDTLDCILIENPIYYL